MRTIALCACLASLLVLATGAGGAARPRLTGSHPCPGQPAFVCSTLTVPLDSTGRVGGSLRLAVAAGSNAAAPRGVLTGGPGEPGVPYISRMAQRLGLGRQYRLVMIDQRGTGDAALRCPALQYEMGFSDLRPPTASAVRACAAAIGSRRVFFGTDDVVRDLDLLRQALGSTKLAIDGTSYGTYVAERYALAYPGHVSRLVLDSVVPQEASGQLETAALPRVAHVLRDVCRASGCPGDPAADLAAAVARYHDGPALLDAIVALSVIDPTYPGVASALHDARAGNPTPMRDLIRSIRKAEASEPASQLSQGLHASTLCADWLWPWGNSSASLAGRKAALDRYASRLPRGAFWPFDRATVTGNGIMQQCLYWPPTPPTPQPPRARMILAPTLVLAGDRDLSTPLPWPRQELKLLAHGSFVTIRGWGHSTQRTATAQAAVQRFLLRG
jgi:pimeloyl-ACP methyl ester carboxylesterase